jgi:tetratricopeptide (TPR) repeat protein
MSRKTAFPPNPFVMTKPALPRLSAEQVYALAVQHHAMGRLQESESLLRQILQARPDHAHALHLLGLIAHQVGKPEAAIELIGKAIASNGKVALFHVNLCGICRKAGRIAEAIKHGERAVALDPQMAVAYGNLGLAYHDNKEFDKDEACQLQALKLQPGSASALFNMASIMRDRYQVDEAISYYRQAIAANPDYLEALNDLGGMLVREGRLEEALDVLGRALQLDPECSLAHCNMGSAFNALERFDAALPHLTKALRLNPDNPDALLAIAAAFKGKRSLADTNLATLSAAALRALELARDKDADVNATLGNVFAELGDTARAADCFDHALKLDPEFAEALLGKGNLCMEMGELDLAEQLFDRASEISGSRLLALAGITKVKKVRAGDRHMAALVDISKQADSLSGMQLSTLHFALGKCYDDVGNYVQAFRHFQEGCRLKRKGMTYDPAENSQLIDSTIAAFDQANLARLRTGGVDSDMPIFVLGMPRSGTTLTEQIIASHPDVYAAGELTDLLQIASRATVSGVNYPENIAGLTPELVTAWAEDYVSGVRNLSPNARHITDKMPANFMFIGLIHAMLPNAKIVHVSRNPVDNCLSCFTNLFGHGLAYSYDLAELGRYYSDYARLMSHWRRVLPEGAFLDVRYEDLVADNEVQARRLIEYCGLEWNDACMESHKTKRPVRTPSVTQVRQPIYTSSIERWRKYEAFLKPLLDELGDLV